MTMRITKDRLKQVLRETRELQNRSVYVGVPSMKATRDEQEKGHEVNNAYIGIIMEFGAPRANIPARPWLVPGVRAAEEKIRQRFKKAAEEIFNGNKSNYEQHLDAAGLQAQNSVKRRIRNVIPPPLSDRTLYARKHRKVAPRQGETPLIDTGKFLNSISYVIRNKGAK